MSQNPFSLFQQAGIDTQVRSFAERYGLNPKEATVMLCKLGLTFYQTVGKEFPAELLRDLASSPEANWQREAEEKDGPAKGEELSPGEHDERRRHHRVNVSLPVLSEVQDPGGKWVPLHGTIMDVSMKGLRLQVPHDAGLIPGSVVKLYFPKHGIETEGTVRHLERSSGGEVVMKVGVELTKMSRGHWLRWLDMVPYLLQGRD